MPFDWNYKMIKKIRVIESDSFDPYCNLAMEECLLRLPAPGDLIFYLWQNERTVVVGKNQNCFRECDVNLLETDGGRLARRISGGGAVYHDAGNLNFSFITTRDDYDEEFQSQIIISAAEKFGVHATKTGRNDIAANGRKFSGNAYFHGANSLRHGTILIGCDLEKLKKYLSAPGGKFETRGVRSVESAVVNLKELNGEINIEKMKAAFIASAEEIYGAETISLCKGEIDEAVYDEARARHASADWKYGKFNDRYERCVSGKFAWGAVEINLNILNGIISSVSIFTDSLDAALPEKIINALKGTRCETAEMRRALENSMPPGEIRDDIIKIL